MAAAGGSRGARKLMHLSPRGGGDRTVFLFDRRREQADQDEKVLSYGKNNYRGFRSAVCQVQGGGGRGVTERVVTRRPARGRDRCGRPGRRRRYRHGEGRGEPGREPVPRSRAQPPGPLRPASSGGAASPLGGGGGNRTAAPPRGEPLSGSSERRGG